MWTAARRGLGRVGGRGTLRDEAGDPPCRLVGRDREGPSGAAWRPERRLFSRSPAIRSRGSVRGSVGRGGLPESSRRTRSDGDRAKGAASTTTQSFADGLVRDNPPHPPLLGRRRLIRVTLLLATPRCATDVK